MLIESMCTLNLRRFGTCIIRKHCEIIFLRPFLGIFFYRDNIDNLFSISNECNETFYEKQTILGINGSR